MANDLTRQSDLRKQNVMKKLLRRYAVLRDDGRVLRCFPTEQEFARGSYDDGNNGKAVFATERTAADFATAVAHDIGGARLRVYECHRGEHFHTTSQEKRKRAGGVRRGRQGDSE